MRILHVDTATTWRGGQNQVLLTAIGLRSRGHAVAVACRAGGALQARLEEAGIETHPVAFRGDLSPLAALAMARVLKSFRPEVVHLHDPHAISAGLMAVRLQPGARLIGGRRVDFPLKGALSRRKYQGCHRVIAVSHAIERVLEASGLSKDQLRVVYEGVPPRPPSPGGREALKALGIGAGVPVIGNVAALVDHKDQATLLSAMPGVLARVQDARLVVVGDGELKGVLEAQARALGVAHRCLFLGFRSDIDALIPAFTVFCLSSRSEGLGTSLLDAMNFSRPIVATAAGGIPEAVLDGTNGLVVPVGDEGALARALSDLLLDEDRREAMGTSGRRLFEERFTDSRMVEGTLKVYEEPS